MLDTLEATNLQALHTESIKRIDRILNQWLPKMTQAPIRLHEAMHYAVTGGGKRVRPLLVYATGTALNIDWKKLDGPACAVELIHAYSLVHDDLPAMDNDDLRRGRPTCHRQFDEATAILTGDALQALAFSVLLHDPNMTSNPQARLAILTTLADASGSCGMAGGQAIDLDAVGKTLDLAALENMHRHKTGALIRASVRMAALSADTLTDEQLTCLDQYADAIGLSFQIVDDILDVVSDTATLGKPQGADQAMNKPTYPALLGLEGAKQHARTMHQSALNSLCSMDNRFNILRDISRYILERTY